MSLVNRLRGKYSVGPDGEYGERSFPEKFIPKISFEAADRIEALEALILHCWVYSGYENCGYKQMTTFQKALYDSLIKDYHEQEDEE
jgi:hypothetical protein